MLGGASGASSAAREGTCTRLHELAGTRWRLKEQERQKQHVCYADAMPQPPQRWVRADERRLWTVDSRVCWKQGRSVTRRAGSWEARASHQGRARGRRRCRAPWRAQARRAGPAPAQAGRCSTQAVKGLPHEPQTLALAASVQPRHCRCTAHTKAKDRDAARSPEQGSPTGVDVLECRVQGTRARACASELRPP